MDYTEGTEQYKMERSKKQMLWFGMISLSMTFAGLTSAYIVSMERKDWLSDYDFPTALIISTILIILSSLTIFLAKKIVLKGNKNLGVILLAITLGLGIAFVISQFLGFQNLIDQGFYFTGETSNITTTFIFLIAALHIVHVAVGLFILLRMLVGAMQEKYTPDSYLGLSLGVTYWHFVDILWCVLFILFYFWK